MILNIQPDGIIRTVYSDNLDLNPLGDVKIERASHVEPNTHGEWTADLTPVGGPVLGPFVKRADALRAEFDWLNDHLKNIL